MKIRVFMISSVMSASMFIIQDEILIYVNYKNEQYKIGCPAHNDQFTLFDQDEQI
tara:strand:- start:304 stop:468 length:165 start_codon:yes stop_codon:yes gene_type:complete